jgi:18S rRNA (guanine1575-N7)-methyltransferase
VLQFYPDGKEQLEMITTSAMKSGFTGGLVIDYPNSTRAKKYYLVIEAGARRNLGIVEIEGKNDKNMESISNDRVKINKNNRRIIKRSKKIMKRK